MARVSFWHWDGEWDTRMRCNDCDAELHGFEGAGLCSGCDNSEDEEDANDRFRSDLIAGV